MKKHLTFCAFVKPDEQSRTCLNYSMMRKRIIRTCLLLLVFFTFWSISVSAETISYGRDGFKYSLDTETKCAELLRYTLKSAEVVIPESVNYDGEEYILTRIGDNCFRNNSRLTSISIPSSVTSLGDFSLCSCPALSKIIVDVKNPVYDSREDCNAIIETATHTMVRACTATTIPSSVTGLGDYCFFGCSSFKSVDIPSSVTSLGDYCFYNCTSLESINIHSSIVRLGNHCFEFCSSLSDVSIPSSVTYIGSGCFSSCPSISKITVDAANPVYDSRENSNGIIETATNTVICGCKNTVIPSTITSLGDSCFAGCTYLASIEIPSSVTSIGNFCFYACSSLKSVDIPSSVTSLGDACFGNCSSLISISIPSSITRLGDWCFFWCGSLESVEIPSSVTSLGDYCFYQCGSLKALDIPTAVTYLGDDCFGNCISLKSIEIPSSVTSLGDNCFEGCISLSSISIPSTVTSLGDWCFSYCESLKSIDIPSSVTSLGEKCFFYCNSLASIDIPASVTSLGNWCFSECSSLVSISIPALVTIVGDGCFHACSSLKVMFCRIENPPVPVVKEFGFFPAVTIGNSTLYVPEASLSQYQSTEPWSGFGTILPIEGYQVGIHDAVAQDMQVRVHDGEVCLENAPNGTPVSIYTLAGNTVGRYKATGNAMTIDLPCHGIFLVKVGDKTFKLRN